jgi:hypothetical protein
LFLILSIKGFQRLAKYKLFLAFIIAINLFLFSLLTLGTKSGGVKVLRDLREEVDKYPIEQHPTLTVMYLCEPHSLPLYTILQRHINYTLIDTSPFRKMENFDEEIELHSNPKKLYIAMSGGNDPEFIIIQEKYATKGPLINENYGFLLQKEYDMISAHRNINLLEEYFLGWDGFVLLKKK